MITPSIQVWRDPYRLILVMPGLPRMQNPSGRPTHWAIVKKERDQWKRLVAVLVRRQHLPLAPLPRAKLTLIRHSHVEPDDDGLRSGFKAVVDGLVQVGVLENDTRKVIGSPEVDWKKAPPKQGFITVEVSEVQS